MVADRVVVSRRICYFVWLRVEKTPDVYIMLKTLLEKKKKKKRKNQKKEVPSWHSRKES